MKDSEKRLAIAVWWAPLYVLFAVSYRQMSASVRLHVRWAVAFLISFLVFALLAIIVSGSLLNAAGLAIVGIIIVGLGIPFLNTLAVLNDRGPFFTKATDN